MAVSFETKGDPVRVVMKIDGKDRETAEAVALDFRRKTGIAVSTDALMKYVIMRRLDKMTVLQGDMEAEAPASKTVIKITFSANEIEAIDEYRRTLSATVGVDIERSKAIKSLLNKGQIALGLEAIFR